VYDLSQDGGKNTGVFHRTDTDLSYNRNITPSKDSVIS